jgi:hypothetical protein
MYLCPKGFNTNLPSLHAKFKSGYRMPRSLYPPFNSFNTTFIQFGLQIRTETRFVKMLRFLTAQYHTPGPNPSLLVKYKPQKSLLSV